MFGRCAWRARHDEVQMMDGLKIGNTFVAGGDRTNMKSVPLLFEEVDVQCRPGADAPTIGVQLKPSHAW